MIPLTASQDQALPQHGFDICGRYDSEQPVLDKVLLYQKKQASLTAKLLLVLASTVILGLESRGTHAHILLSHVSGSCATFNEQASYSVFLFSCH
jgi:hypothetical protein